MNVHINWGKVASVGLNVAGLIIPQIHAVEVIAKALPELSGAAKEDAAVQLAREAIEGAETVAGKELVRDPEFDAASRSFVQAYVALQNVVSKKPAQPANASTAQQ